MARLPYQDPARAPEPVREALEALPPLNIFRMIANAHTAFRPFLAFGGAILSSLSLDAVLRELVILRVARLLEAEYEWVQHAAIARSVGASELQIDAVDRGATDDESLGPRERAVLAFTTEVVTEVRASDETFAAMQHHFDTREVVETLLTIGQYTMVAKVMTHLDLDLDEALGPDVLERAQQRRRETGE